MEYTVTLQPSNRLIQTESHETLLETLLRSGVSVAYHCSSGSCGECVARLLEGELQQQNHDYRLSAQQQSRGEFLLCRASAASNLILELHELDNPASIPIQKLETKIDKFDASRSNFLIIQLRTPRSNTLQFMAGQAITMQLANGARYTTNIASCPCSGMYIQIHLPCDSNNEFITTLIDSGEKGTKIDIIGPYGTITLKEQHERPLLFIAIDHYFSGIKSLLEQVNNLEMEQPIRLCRIATMRREHYLENYCRSWYDQLDDYQYFPLEQIGTGVDEALLDKIFCIIKQDIGDLDQIDCYVGANDEDVGIVERYWLDHGGHLDHLFPVTTNCDMAPIS